MKKVLVVLLALALVLSLTGMALAQDLTRHKKCCPSQKNWSKVVQVAPIDNFVNANSGNVNSTGNLAPTVITGNTSSADSCAGCATNTAPVTVTNTGISAAGSGDANLTSTNTNTVGQGAVVTQSNSSTCTSTECNTNVFVGAP